MTPTVERPGTRSRRMSSDANRIALLGTWLLFALACGGDDGVTVEDDPCDAAFISLESGDDQLGRPGAPLADPVTVRLVDGTGAPLRQEGCGIAWTVLEGGGSVSSASSASANDGTAVANWTLGPEEGVQSLRATLDRGLSTVGLAVALDSVRSIVYVRASGQSDPGGDSGQLYTMNADGSNGTPLTTGRYADELPRWSPDGTKVAFIRRFSETCSAEQGDLMVIDLVTYTSKRLTDDGPCAASSGLSWSPDGTSIVMHRDDDLVEVDAATGSSSPLVTGPGRQFRPAWGTSGLAWSHDEDPGDATALMFRPTEGDDTVDLHSGGSDFNASSWSRDGSRLTVFRKTPPQSLNWSLWVHRLETGDFTQIPGSQDGWAASFSPDGASVIATIRGSLDGGLCTGIGEDYLVIIDLNSGERTEVTEPCTIRSRAADWRPTG